MITAMAMGLRRPRILLLVVWVTSCTFVLRSEAYIGSSGAVIDPARVKQISWKPRAFVYKGLLTDLECDHLISLARSELTRSTVVKDDKGGSALSEVRTSSGMFISKAKDPIVAGIEQKIATWTFLPVENGEDIQVLRYEYGQKYDSHHDFFEDSYNLARGGNRVATVLMYLSDVKKGGETVFPSADEPLRRRAAELDPDLSDCAKRGVAVRPQKGDALLFFSLKPDSIPDILSLHGGCPVIEGEKWSATKWIHVDQFDKIIQQSADCADQNDSCVTWAAHGECSKNPIYMVGSPDQPGSCRRSCNACH